MLWKLVTMEFFWSQLRIIFTVRAVITSGSRAENKAKIEHINQDFGLEEKPKTEVYPVSDLIINAF